ncbi:MAG: AbrB/MazE/SpoVT family DNA-binding domain-containing protein [Betaproteobacteria bacterium]|nr:AbrB/MazE/SpoVT family DNA-binding domain-containing protein [Betaproteobacteria bacterium]
MSEPTTISSKGQVTVPRDVRERLGLQAGDKIAWSMLSNGTIVLRPKTRRLRRIGGHPDAAGAARRFRRRDALA